MALCPFAVHRLIPVPESDPRIRPRIGILHVDAGNADTLYYLFLDNQSNGSGIEAHFFVKRDGTIEQYRDTEYQADANLDANDFAVSIETQGFGVGEWTFYQIESIQKLMDWLHQEHHIPYRRVTSWNDEKGGWGYHTMWGAPSQWTPVAKTCPGPDRIAQFQKILVPWLVNSSEDDMFEDSDRALLKSTNESVTRLALKIKDYHDSEQARDKRLRERLTKRYNATKEELDQIFAEVDNSI